MRFTVTHALEIPRDPGTCLSSVPYGHADVARPPRPAKRNRFANAAPPPWMCSRLALPCAHTSRLSDRGEIRTRRTRAGSDFYRMRHIYFLIIISRKNQPTLSPLVKPGIRPPSPRSGQKTYRVAQGFSRLNLAARKVCTPPARQHRWGCAPELLNLAASTPNWRPRRASAIA